MRWRKLGLVWGPDGHSAWAVSHAMSPTPFRLNDEVVRIFTTCRDAQGRGRPTAVDVAAADPTRVVGVVAQPVLDIGEPGTFDENGVVAQCVVEPEPGLTWMYYSGFELCTLVPYRILTGLAVSHDGGKTFRRHSRAPILDRSGEELYFRASPFVLREGGVWKLWYVAGSEWTQVDGKARPVYDLRYQESEDGIRWQPEGTRSLTLADSDEHGFGRPWVVKRGPDDYQLYYSIRRRSLGAYRLGYAESADGIHWIRKDGELGLDVSPGAFDSHAMMYSAVISVAGHTYCFYNGNGFGERGVAVAELIA